MKRISAIITSLCVAGAISASATALTYSDGTCTRDGAFRMGTTTTQGIAMRLPAEKVAQLKGARITGISASFGSARTTDSKVTLFVTTELDATSAVAQSATIARAVQWADYALDTPYTISGNEPELYIGYTTEIGTTQSVLMADGASDIPGTSYAYSDGNWIDIAGTGHGSANIKVTLEDAPEFTDMILKPMDVDGYFKAREEYEFSGEAFNFGTVAVNSLDITIKADGETVSSSSLTGLDIAPGTSHRFDFPISIPHEGIVPVTIEVTGVNGGTETLTADNGFDADLCFYPAEMERAYLLEGFTGQACSNCPEGHRTINSFLATAATPVIEVMHHAGYQPDLFTMDADLDYTMFYGATNTYAPAIMMSRTRFASIGNVPVMHTSAANLLSAYNELEKSQPYASLGLITTYDTDTREVTIKVITQAHNDMPAKQNVVNVMLIQDGLVGSQSGGSSTYQHNCVFRGTLTGDSWGLRLPDEACVAGGKSEWEHSFTLPEAIFSDYWASTATTESARARYTHAVVPENMKIVAYVGALGEGDINGHRVYNAIEVPLGSSYEQKGLISGIESVVADATPSAAISVEGRKINIAGEYDSAAIYTLTGRMLPLNTMLETGVYIVRVKSGNALTTKKILVK